MRAGWGQLAYDYLSEREELRLSIQLIDSRHEPTALDQELNDWLTENEKPRIVVATKADKLGANQLKKQLNVIKNTLNTSGVIPYSSLKGKGRDEVWTAIAKFL